MFWSPVKIATVGILVWLCVRFGAPLATRIELSGGALFFISLNYALYFVGCYLGHSIQIAGRSDSNVSDLPINVQVKAEYVAFCLGVFGVALRYFDRVAIRGVDYGGGALEVREALANSSVSIVGMIGTILFPMCLIPFMSYLTRVGTQKSYKVMVIYLIIFFLPALESLGQLSRSVLLLTVMILLISITCLKFGGSVLKGKILWPVGLSVLVMLFVSSLIFESRLNAESRDLRTSTQTSVYSELIHADEDAITTMISGDEFNAKLYEAFLPNALYYTSGMYEFTLLWERPDAQFHSLGTYTFSPIFIAIDRFTGLSLSQLYDETALVYRVGVFNTFFGPMWIDFGWFSPIVMCVFGAICQWVAIKAQLQRGVYFPLHAILSAIVFYAPVVNYLSNGLGLFFVAAFTAYAFVLTRVFVSNRTRRLA